MTSTVPGPGGVRPPQELPDHLLARAVEIADRTMFEYLRSFGVWSMGEECSCDLAGDDAGEVDTIVQASEPLREAVAWLQERGYVHLATEPSGRQHVTIVRHYMPPIAEEHCAAQTLPRNTV